MLGGVSDGTEHLQRATGREVRGVGGGDLRGGDVPGDVGPLGHLPVDPEGGRMDERKRHLEGDGDIGQVGLTAWKDPIGRPNCLRDRAYSLAMSIIV